MGTTENLILLLVLVFTELAYLILTLQSSDCYPRIREMNVTVIGRNPGKNATNTTNMLDVAGTAWVCASWNAGERHKSANQVTGLPPLFHNYKKSIRLND